MNPTILGVIGPGFLNQVPTLLRNLDRLYSQNSGIHIRNPNKGPRFLNSGSYISVRVADIEAGELETKSEKSTLAIPLNPKPVNDGHGSCSIAKDSSSPRHPIDFHSVFRI